MYNSSEWIKGRVQIKIEIFFLVFVFWSFFFLILCRFYDSMLLFVIFILQKKCRQPFDRIGRCWRSLLKKKFIKSIFLLTKFHICAILSKRLIFDKILFFFGKKIDFWQKYWFFQDFIFWAKNRFLPNYWFLTNFFFTNKSIFDKFLFFDKKSKFWEKYWFLLFTVPEALTLKTLVNSEISVNVTIFSRLA